MSHPESILRIGATQVDGYESRSRVLAVAVDGEAELALILDSTGEGFNWMQAVQFRLSDDGKELTSLVGGRLGAKRILCSREAE